MKWLADLLLCFSFLAFARTPDPKDLLKQAKAAKPPEAIQLLQQANEIWAKEASDDPAYAESLDMLVLLLRNPLLEDPDISKAEVPPLAQHALEIRESHPDTRPEDLALALEIQADVIGRKDAGAPFWERAAGIRTQRVAAVPSDKYVSSGDPAMKMGNGVSQPVLIKKREPEYSEMARVAKVSGTILLSLVIDQNGIPGQFKLRSGVGYGLDEKAAEAVSSWRFRPATKDGQPVAVMSNVEVNFRLL